MIRLTGRVDVRRRARHYCLGPSTYAAVRRASTATAPSHRPHAKGSPDGSAVIVTGLRVGTRARRVIARKLCLALFGLLLLCPPKVFCQERKTDSAQRYVVLATAKTATLQKEVDQAAAAGYRVALGDAAYNVLILEKASAPPRREYRVLWSLQDQLKKASDEGFRVIPATLVRNIGREPS